MLINEIYISIYKHNISPWFFLVRVNNWIIKHIFQCINIIYIVNLYHKSFFVSGWFICSSLGFLLQIYFSIFHFETETSIRNSFFIEELKIIIVIINLVFNSFQIGIFQCFLTPDVSLLYQNVIVLLVHQNFFCGRTVCRCLYTFQGIVLFLLRQKSSLW